MSVEHGDYANDPHFQSFIEEQVQKQRFQNLVGNLTDKCWDLCVDKPSPRLESRTETCLISCVERFLDSTHFVLNRFEKANKKLESSNLETLID
ncbi:mitochondrial import inner membrane translocase subunit Tim8 A-like [Lycorma delicatula]|uniref:mitochondrial import inner membrane translocase subunit Tim8 A-like n=1 Tax=Lycorma delicatula TaxID=130591 RepID=UPI003F516813